MPSLPIVPTQVTLKENMRSLDAPTASQLFKIWPYGAEYCTDSVVNGLKKSAKIGEANGMPSLPTGPTQVAKTGNVGYVDVFRAAYLSTFGPRGKGNGLRGS